MRPPGSAKDSPRSAERPSGVRVRSHWFKSERPKTVEEIAGAVAFIVWRVAQQALRNMRSADFEIEVGPRFFAFLAEWLAFLAQVTDRTAYERFGEGRLGFTTVVANRLGETLAGNRSDLLGSEGGADQKSAFIDLFNLRLDDYVDFGLDDYGRMRYLAQKLAQVVGPHDQLWIHEQVMEIEAPQAVGQIHKAILDLLGEGPRRGRRPGAVGGE